MDSRPESVFGWRRWYRENGRSGAGSWRWFEKIEKVNPEMQARLAVLEKEVAALCTCTFLLDLPCNLPSHCSSFWRAFLPQLLATQPTQCLPDLKLHSKLSLSRFPNVSSSIHRQTRPLTCNQPPYHTRICRLHHLIVDHPSRLLIQKGSSGDCHRHNGSLGTT